MNNRQCVEIGDSRSMTASTAADHLAITKFFPQPDGSFKSDGFTLSTRAVEKIHRNMNKIRSAVDLHKTNQLSATYSLHLGNNIYLTISQSVRCVGIREFFRPRNNQALLLPGRRGMGLKFKEFEALHCHWATLYSCVDTDLVILCDHVAANEGCLYCFF